MDKIDIEKLTKDGDMLFDIDDREFNVKAWYLENNEEMGVKGDALIELRYRDELVRTMLYPSYKIYNVAAHFHDIVDGELSKDDKARGYLIAGSMGFGGYVMPTVVSG